MTTRLHYPYFESGGLIMKSFVKSDLMDGVVSLNELQAPRITRQVPRDPLIWGLQSGPVVFENGTPAKLDMTRDENKRRVMVSVTGSNELVFMVIYNPDSVFLGPMIGELPNIIVQINEKTDLNLADAINLDGGSASAFIERDGFSLHEISNVGSFFCVK